MAIEIESKITQIIQRTYNVKSFRFVPGQKIDYKAGQFLQATIDVDGAPVSKYLSISSSPTQSHIEFTKKLTGSPFSNVLDNKKEGDNVKLKLPMGNFTLGQGHKKIVFLSGGIGITPIMSMCSYVADTKLDTDIVLLFSNRTVKDIAFKQELDEISQHNTNIRVLHTLSDEDAASCGPNARIGRIDKDMVIKEVPDYAARVFYICGPPQMVETMKCIITDGLGLGAESIKTENFAGY